MEIIEVENIVLFTTMINGKKEILLKIERLDSL